MLNAKLLKILVCPVTKGPLIYKKEQNELISKSAGLAYPVRDGIPVLLEDEARQLSEEEKEDLFKPFSKKIEQLESEKRELTALLDDD